MHFTRAITGPLFRFVVGPERVVVIVYQEILASISEPFRAMMESNMIEGVLSEATLTNVEVEVFAATYEYALKRNYSVPSMNLTEILGWPEECDSDESEGNFEKASKPRASFLRKMFQRTPSPTYVFPRQTRPARTSPEMTWDMFITNIQNRPAPPSGAYVQQSDCELMEMPNSNHKEESLVHINPAFHAKVYCFAQEKLSPYLKTYALGNFQRDLEAFPIEDGTVHILLELCDFIYANTARFDGSSFNSLRHVLLLQIASASSFLLRKNELFLDWLENNAELGTDLFREIW